ncbi:MAG: 16S rRNA (guanine(966)-N(2))-methyltransferase RsmD [Thiohalocapsa sp.]|nr:16S rRNA (guanine(966)-N(2))-methyltransferase RsmD [Thiohalocapsa sp.]
MPRRSPRPAAVAEVKRRGARGGAVGRGAGPRPAGRAGQLRIVGGRHRGRKLPVPIQPGLRPTADRTRETLFNWLAPVIAGSRCLDCFAGSGALALEALSRGAARVLMIERAPAVADQLRANLCALSVPAEAADVVEGDALRWLADAPVQPFDIVFLDPPFADALLAPVCEVLQRRGWVAPGALIYLEAPGLDGMGPLPPTWSMLREKRAGHVAFGLAEVGGETL